MTESAPHPDRVLTLTGADLDPAALGSIAHEGVPVRIADSARAAMNASHETVRRAAQSGRPIYGVTTGLGSRVTQTVDAEDGGAYSMRTIRGRATAVGEPLDRALTRAAMAVRANGLCAAGAGASPAVAEALAALLNAGVHPLIPRSGSIGAADLCLMAHVGLGLIGEGEAELGGETLPAGEALARAGLRPLALGPKDGLAICSSSAVAIAAAALALTDARACLEAVQISAALSMEGFRANLTPLDPRVVDARPAPGQRWSADGLRVLLAGGELAATETSRRLQDPLSFRCISPTHGALHAALGALEQALAPDLNGAADNPLVLGADHVDDREPHEHDHDLGAVLPNGNFSSPALALALDTVAIACAQVAHMVAERQARLTEARMSGLPVNLVDVDPALAPTRSGVGPLSKTAQALALEIRHLAAPVAIHAAITADGVEDDSTGAVQGALRLRTQLERLRSLIALELLVGAQAVDVASPLRLGDGTAAAHRCIREVVPPLREDRALGAEVTRLDRALLAEGRLAVGVAGALAASADHGGDPERRREAREQAA